MLKKQGFIHCTFPTLTGLHAHPSHLSPALSTIEVHLIKFPTPDVIFRISERLSPSETRVRKLALAGSILQACFRL